MPTLYEYMGIFFYFWSDEHDPIHVHAEYNGTECKVLLYPDGRIEIENYLLKNNMDTQTLKKVRKFAEKYQDAIKEKWAEYHLFKKKIKPQRITRKIK